MAGYNNVYNNSISSNTGNNRRGTWNAGNDNSRNSRNNLASSSFPPVGYLEGGYFEDSGKTVLKKKYIIEYPLQISRSLENTGRDMNKRSQIRKFYEYALRVYDNMKQNGKGFPAIEAELAELDPFVKYAEQRKLVSREFVDFIERNLQAVSDETDFRAFIKHFEAIIAYTKKN